MHSFLINSTANSLSFFVVYMSHHIKSDSVASYLSGICHQLKPYFSNVQAICNSYLVTQTLTSCCKLYNTSAFCHMPLIAEHLIALCDALSSSSDYDDTLFLTLILVDIFGLLWLEELVTFGIVADCNHQKLILHSSLCWDADAFGFTLPTYKADRFFQKNDMLICLLLLAVNVCIPFMRYLLVCDHAFLLHTAL